MRCASNCRNDRHAAECCNIATGCYGHTPHAEEQRKCWQWRCLVGRTYEAHSRKIVPAYFGALEIFAREKQLVRNTRVCGHLFRGLKAVYKNKAEDQPTLTFWMPMMWRTFRERILRLSCRPRPSPSKDEVPASRKRQAFRPLQSQQGTDPIGNSARWIFPTRRGDSKVSLCKTIRMLCMGNLTNKAIGGSAIQRPCQALACL